MKIPQTKNFFYRKPNIFKNTYKFQNDLIFLFFLINDFKYVIFKKFFRILQRTIKTNKNKNTRNRLWQSFPKTFYAFLTML